MTAFIKFFKFNNPNIFCLMNQRPQSQTNKSVDVRNGPFSKLNTRNSVC